MAWPERGDLRVVNPEFHQHPPKNFLSSRRVPESSLKSLQSPIPFLFLPDETVGGFPNPSEEDASFSAFV